VKYSQAELVSRILTPFRISLIEQTHLSIQCQGALVG